jgi:biopolymer transport protein ExbD
MAELNSSPEKNTGKNLRKRLSTRVDLTAMVDLAFLLITFFMLTTSLMKPQIFNVTMPDKSPANDSLTVSENRTMTICLGKNNQVISYLGLTEKPITAPQITGYGKDGIRKAIIENGKRVSETTGKAMFVIIKPSVHSVYDNLVSTLDEVHIAGATGYAIEDITSKEIALLKQKGIY